MRGGAGDPPPCWLANLAWCNIVLNCWRPAANAGERAPGPRRPSTGTNRCRRASGGRRLGERGVALAWPQRRPSGPAAAILPGSRSRPARPHCAPALRARPARPHCGGPRQAARMAGRPRDATFATLRSAREDRAGGMRAEHGAHGAHAPPARSLLRPERGGEGLSFRVVSRSVCARARPLRPGRRLLSLLSLPSLLFHPRAQRHPRPPSARPSSSGTHKGRVPRRVGLYGARCRPGCVGVRVTGEWKGEGGSGRGPETEARPAGPRQEPRRFRSEERA